MAIAYVYSIILTAALAVFVVMLSMIFSDEGKLDFVIDRGKIAISILLYLLIICPILAMLLHPLRGIPVGPLVLFGLIYFGAWYFTFLDATRFRWFGYLSANHVEITGVNIPGCSKIYVLWVGEKNTLVECWRKGQELKQQIYILQNGGNLQIGPIAADPAAEPPFRRYGPLPPPEDRMSDEMRKSLGIP